MRHEDVNSQYFSAERVKAGAMSTFLSTLFDWAYGQDDDTGGTYNDVHVYPADCGAFIVEWAQVPWDHSYRGGFQYVAEDQVVLVERGYPDGSYDFFPSEEEYQTALADWLLAHPEYKRDHWGHWYNSEDEDVEDDAAEDAEDDGEEEPADTTEPAEAQ